MTPEVAAVVVAGIAAVASISTALIGLATRSRVETLERALNADLAQVKGQLSVILPLVVGAEKRALEHG